VSDGAGWFGDPSGKIGTFRWWDGRAWTRWLSTDPAAPDPGSVLVAEPPTPASLPADDPPPDDTAYAPPDPADRVVGLPVAAAVIIGGVLLAIIAVGAIISLTADRPLTGPAVAPPPPTEAPLAVLFDSASRAVSADELRVVLPASPFTCDPGARDVPDLFTSAISCSAPVHTDYDDKNDWTANTGVGVLDEQVRSAKDLREMAARTGSGLLSRNYTVEDVTIKKVKNVPFPDVAPDGKARRVTAELHVSYPDLPSKYDRMSVAVFELESGEHVAWWALEPDDSPKAVTEALEASAATLTARK
jgi:Protein of unknown function (DUF2510)